MRGAARWGARSIQESTFDLESTLREAAAREPAFERLVAGVPYEPKGVFTSEMLFLVAAVGEHRPRQIVESGRARGQSTCLLGLAYPDTPIASIEWDPESPDVPVAAERCRDLPNVELLFGDANVELLARVGAGDVVVIDGPKGWKALDLALRVLERRRPAAVFIHDCYRGQAERRFLERFVPGAFFSDDRRFEKAFSHLDSAVFATPEQEGFDSWRPHRFLGAEQESYGPTYGCLPYIEHAAYGRIRRRMHVTWRLRRLGRSLGKRLRPTAAPA